MQAARPSSGFSDEGPHTCRDTGQKLDVWQGSTLQTCLLQRMAFQVARAIPCKAMGCS